MANTVALRALQFGVSDMQLAHLGFGCWAAGRDGAIGWDSQDDRLAARTFRQDGARGI
jgi:hypothetical protein